MKYLLIVLFTCFFTNCKSQEKAVYTRYIEDIEYDSTLDDGDFKVCHGDDRVIQYFNNGGGLEYEGDKPAIEKAFNEKYNDKDVKKESGLIRIRFIVNCNGATGRFRVLGMNENYKEKQFDKNITNQILKITKNLKGWQLKDYKNRKADYYQYLIFKIKDGKIINILP